MIRQILLQLNSRVPQSFPFTQYLSISIKYQRSTNWHKLFPRVPDIPVMKYVYELPTLGLLNAGGMRFLVKRLVVVFDFECELGSSAPTFKAFWSVTLLRLVTASSELYDDFGAMQISLTLNTFVNSRYILLVLSTSCQYPWYYLI